MQTITPYKTDESKKEQVRFMFNNIAGTYDKLNRIISLGIDQRWRRRAIAILSKEKPKAILDVATGTADFALAASSLKEVTVTGVDIAEDMLAIGREKVKTKGLEKRIELICADSENLPFESNKFDATIVSFGVRNFENLEKGLSEILRVIKPGGLLIVLEGSTPQHQPMKFFYKQYVSRLLPWVGKLISKDKSAYQYLPDSIKAFPCGKDFTAILDRVGFKKTYYEEQTFGVCTIYVGRKA
ncbi:MAG: bifunctional demethylmenaquinone methyltransferase/2-methoxy-6-polyprenyl,4-benzoquinol methylase [Cytophagaceae bacterium]|jgi:demethylmenaquinone methyltransferase/2-methoxy-6-polyprenyl-1,4-benzoquinol methylase|nr:bifunctional demethylmenaquinone methyltransferase/2-methoxy-6-polyprenyl,4-benzoquinol methylase [Cytophagaceae bacterium]